MSLLFVFLILFLFIFFLSFVCVHNSLLLTFQTFQTFQTFRPLSISYTLIRHYLFFINYIWSNPAMSAFAGHTSFANFYSIDIYLPHLHYSPQFSPLFILPPRAAQMLPYLPLFAPNPIQISFSLVNFSCHSFSLSPAHPLCGFCYLYNMLDFTFRK